MLARLHAQVCVRFVCMCVYIFPSRGLLSALGGSGVVTYGNPCAFCTSAPSPVVIP